MSDKVPKRRWCGWCKTKHLLGDFNDNQHYCKTGMTQYRRRLRGATEEEARRPVQPYRKVEP